MNPDSDIYYNGYTYQVFLNLPFGETMAEQITSSGYYQNHYKFNGKELDNETGMYYYGARYYEPRLSVWMSVDPLAEKYPGISPYNYTFDNPTRYVDPNGKGPKDIARGFISAMIDYNTFGITNLREQTIVDPSVAEDFNTGLLLADSYVMAAALAEIGGGGGMSEYGVRQMEGGVVLLVVPGGGEIAFAVSESEGAAIIGVGLLIALHGEYMFNKALRNFFDSKGKRDVPTDNFAKKNSQNNQKNNKEGIGSRNTYKGDKMGSNTKAKEQINSVAKDVGVDRKSFGDYVERMKKLQGKGGADNYSYQQLKNLAKIFKEAKE